MKKVHVLVVENNRLLRERLITVLEKQSDLSVMVTLEDAEAVLGVMSKTPVDVVLLNLGMEHRNNLPLVRMIKATHPESMIIVMDLIELQTDVFEFVRAGTAGFILKDAKARDILRTIRSVADGIIVLPPYLAKSLFSQIIQHAGMLAHPSALADAMITTRRQRQVIELIADGLTNKEIARQLHLSPYTVKSHVHNILEKLSLHTRVQIANHVHAAEVMAAVFAPVPFAKN